MAILEVQVERRSPVMRQKRVGKWIENPLSPSGRNNGSQAHEINKWALRGVNGFKGVQKERKSKPWAVYDVEK